MSEENQKDGLEIPVYKKRTWKEDWQSCIGFERHKSLLQDNHMINIRVRKDGQWHEIDADWLKALVRQEFPNK